MLIRIVRIINGIIRIKRIQDRKNQSLKSRNDLLSIYLDDYFEYSHLFREFLLQNNFAPEVIISEFNKLIDFFTKSGKMKKDDLVEIGKLEYKWISDSNYNKIHSRVLHDNKENISFNDNIYLSYEEAKQNNEQRLFYLGKGKYFHREHDWGTHSTSRSFCGLMGYLEKFGNKEMLNSFKEDLKNILEQDLTISEFLSLINYVWIYLVRYYENENSGLTLEWRVEEYLRVLIVKKFDSFPKV